MLEDQLRAMVATSGDRLLDPDAEQAIRDLLPLADVITPNLAELAVLVEDAEEGRAGARAPDIVASYTADISRA